MSSLAIIDDEFSEDIGMNTYRNFMGNAKNWWTLLNYADKVAFMTDWWHLLEGIRIQFFTDNFVAGL